MHQVRTCSFYVSIPRHRPDVQNGAFQQDVCYILKQESGKIHFWEMVSTWSKTLTIFRLIAQLVSDIKWMFKIYLLSDCP